MKKTCSVFVMLLLICFSFALVGCSNDVDKNIVYDQATGFFQKVDEDKTPDGMLVTTSAYGVQTDYALNLFLANVTYNYYNQIFILPMNYLKQYSEDLAKLKTIDKISAQGQTAVNNFSAAMTGLESSYEECKYSYDVFKNLITLQNDPITREGALTVFNQAYMKMLNKLYEAVDALIEIKNQVFNDFEGLKVSNRVLTKADTRQLRDYMLVTLVQKYYRALAVELDMKDFSDRAATEDVVTFAALNRWLRRGLNSLYELQSVPEDMLKTFVGKANTETVADEVIILNYEYEGIKNLFDLHKTIENEEVLLNQALNNFDLIKFYENYSCDIVAYEKMQEHATQYYEEIRDFYITYLNNYFENLSNALIEE